LHAPNETDKFIYLEHRYTFDTLTMERRSHAFLLDKIPGLFAEIPG